jgi:hypothetical protein
VNEELVAALARALDVPIPPDRVAGVSEQLAGQLAGEGGMNAEELDGVEPAIVFEPGWGARP